MCNCFNCRFCFQEKGIDNSKKYFKRNFSNKEGQRIQVRQKTLRKVVCQLLFLDRSKFDHDLLFRTRFSNTMMLHLKLASCLLQHDTSVPIPSPVTASVYGRIPVTNFPPNLPSFPGDAFGVSDRPKKVTLLSIVLKICNLAKKR